jgi:hypothetical protein
MVPGPDPGADPRRLAGQLACQVLAPADRVPVQDPVAVLSPLPHPGRAQLSRQGRRPGTQAVEVGIRHEPGMVIDRRIRCRPAMQLIRRPGRHLLPGTGSLPGPRPGPAARQVLRVARGPAAAHRPAPPGQ